MATNKVYHHPLLIRLTHWINAIALLVMVFSGLRIYNASPIFDFTIPRDLTLGGWLGGARLWHFAAMWIFLLNGLVYVFYNLLSRHGRETTLVRKSDLPGVLPMILYYLRIRKEHPAQGKYNALQKLTYTQIPLLGLGSILTGIAIYWPVQMSWITWCFGGYDTARVWHFLFTAAFVLFLLGHLVMVAIAGWSNFVSMITGWGKPTEHSAQ
ncbi:MAG: cytochrome b/b6 domain-containing protein [Bacteroidetes bacterium]|nr:cytochrome b/b6 domain-containing protein [Bacteroidota bacterium]